jgi:predicted nuclease of restriction endonuclease-like (RecB) superfamily
MENYSLLTTRILDTHKALQKRAYSSINQTLTVRNWLVGLYIIEYEQKGEDRAAYGSGLIAALAKSLSIKGLTAPELSRCRQFYATYPYFSDVLLQNETQLIPDNILGSLTQNFKKKPVNAILGSATQESKTPVLRVPTEKILTKLSYTHLVELIKIEDDLKRTFYEIECIKGTWSVRELKRQISSLYYERSGLSAKPNTLSELTQLKTDTANPTAFIKNIYAFEFLDIASKEAIEESDLETALLDNLHQFIIELGNGFC